MLLLFKEDRHEIWMGTILLSGGMVSAATASTAAVAPSPPPLAPDTSPLPASFLRQVMERPSRKEGFTFKFQHPLRAAIHAARVGYARLGYLPGICTETQMAVAGAQGRDLAQPAPHPQRPLHVPRLHRKGLRGAPSPPSTLPPLSGVFRV